MKRKVNPTFVQIRALANGTLVDEKDAVIASVFPSDPDLDPQMLANTYRILDCVNGCQDVPKPHNLPRVITAAQAVLNQPVPGHGLSNIYIDELIKALADLGI